MTPKDARLFLAAGVRVTINPGAEWFRTEWFPKDCAITGEVEKVTSSGRVTVAVDQLPKESHQHGRRSLSFAPAEVAGIIFDCNQCPGFSEVRPAGWIAGAACCDAPGTISYTCPRRCTCHANN